MSAYILSEVRWVAKTLGHEFNSARQKLQRIPHYSQQVMGYHSVFVYGTLKRGEPNYHWFKPENGYFKFLSKGITEEKYPLIIGTRYNIPFLLYSPGNGTNVVGEIYEVDDKMLQNLDILEEHPDFYVREEKSVRRSDTNANVTCWIYFLKQFRPELLNSTFFSDYSTSGSHGLKYIERYLRDASHPAREEVFLDKKLDEK